MNEKEVVVSDILSKPVTLLKEDFVQNLIELCNNSGLPLFVIEYILKDLYIEVKATARKQYESDLIKYKNAQEGKKQGDIYE